MNSLPTRSLGLMQVCKVSVYVLTCVVRVLGSSLEEKDLFPPCMKKVCVVSNKAQYLSGYAKQFPDDIPARVCNHVIFSGAKLNGNRLAPSQWNDESTNTRIGNYEKAWSLKYHNPKIKVLLSVGGSYAGPAAFKAMTKTKATRTEFIMTSIAYIRRFFFDGIDIDWRYPDYRDKYRFTALMKELIYAFHEERQNTSKTRLLLTARFSPTSRVVSQAYDLPLVVNRYLDFMTLITYDLYGPWDGITGNPSQLHAESPESTWSVDGITRFFRSRGVLHDKIVITVPLFGRSFTLKTASNYGMGAPVVGAGGPGKYTKARGILAYYEICEMLQEKGTLVDVTRRGNLYMVKGKLWVGFENTWTLREKIQYILQNHIGGIMILDTSFDDTTGKFCKQGPFPLLYSIANYTLCKGDLWTNPWDEPQKG